MTGAGIMRASASFSLPGGGDFDLGFPGSGAFVRCPYH